MMITILLLHLYLICHYLGINVYYWNFTTTTETPFTSFLYTFAHIVHFIHISNWKFRHFFNKYCSGTFYLILKNYILTRTYYIISHTIFEVYKAISYLEKGNQKVKKMCCINIHLIINPSTFNKCCKYKLLYMIVTHYQNKTLHNKVFWCNIYIHVLIVIGWCFFIINGNHLKFNYIIKVV